MQRLLRKLRQLILSTILLLIAAYAVGMALNQNKLLFLKVFWIGATTVFVGIFLIFLERILLKNRSKDSQGYIIIKGTNEYEHRYIAKQILNRKLLPNEVVHHINGKRSDNRLINLCVMDRHQHEIFHAWLDWKKRKSGRYPSFEEQKRLLSQKHNGILLENRSGFKIRTSASPFRPTFLSGRAQVDSTEQSEAFSRKLFSDLKRERMRLANERNIPAYLVFKNFTLTEMVQQMPQDAEAMANITGVTEEKLRLYGDCFLAVIWKYKANTEDLKKRNSVS